MNVYTTDKIRNVVLLGHGGCGKTSLVEAMAYLSGITSRMGKITDGNTVSDYGKEEQNGNYAHAEAGDQYVLAADCFAACTIPLQHRGQYFCGENE